jgi:hypothetical protein
MIIGIHALVFSKQPKKMRAFFRDKLGFKGIDAGNGRLIFALPPAELGVHETQGPNKHELYLMCDDLNKTVKRLKAKGVSLAEPITNAGWGLFTRLKLPGRATIGLYEPRHLRPKPWRARRTGRR